MKSNFKLKALVIEPYSELRDLIREELQREFQFQTFGSHDIAEAEELMKVGPFSLIICNSKNIETSHAYYKKCMCSAQPPKIFYMTGVRYDIEIPLQERNLLIDHEKNFRKIFKNLESYFKS